MALRVTETGPTRLSLSEKPLVQRQSRRPGRGQLHWRGRPGTEIARSPDRRARATESDPACSRTQCRVTFAVNGQPVRGRLLGALSAELEAGSDPRARATADELIELTRSFDDPALRGVALLARTRMLSFERENGERAELGRELVRLGTAHGIATYTWVGEHTVGTAAFARGDVAATRRSVEQGLRVAETYRMAEPRAVSLCALAMLAHIEGDLADSERLYDTAAELMRHHGSIHGAGFQVMAIWSLRLNQGRLAEYEPAVREMHRTYRHLGADLLATTLVAAGRIDEARALCADLPPLPDDFFTVAFNTVRAMLAVAFGDRRWARQLYDALLPAQDQIAGAASLSLALRPVAFALGELALVRGRPAEAAEHFDHARTIARRYGSPRWEAEAVAALARGRATTTS